MAKTARTTFVTTKPSSRDDTPRRRGRRPSGSGGQRVSDYPYVMIRLPQQTKATLDALSGITGTPVWQLVDRAIASYVAQLPAGERKLMAEVRSHRARNASES